MPIEDPSKLMIDVCSCGRRADKRHCPFCGSQDVYSRAHKHDATIVSHDTGNTITVGTFRCKRCGSYFNDAEWRTDCKAPIYKTAAMIRKEEIEAGIVKTVRQQDGTVKRVKPLPTKMLSSNAQLIVINELRALRGLPQIDEMPQNVTCNGHNEINAVGRCPKCDTRYVDGECLCPKPKP